MFGLDHHIASLSDGTTLAVVMVVSLVLGLRHASDPDHVAAVTTLVASGQDRAARSAVRLGFVWGLGHATSLVVFGLPVVLYRAYLPESLQRDAETVVGIMIIILAVRLLLRSRHGHWHGATRAPAQAYAIGLVHGTGGTAGIGLLLLAAIPNHALAIGSLLVFAFFTAVSMAILSGGFGLTLDRPRARGAFYRIAPVMACLSLAFGIWYALGAQNLVPYVF